MKRNMSRQGIGDEDVQEASDRRRCYLKRSISPVRNTKNKKPKAGSSSNNELYYLNLPSKHLINKQQLELCGKIPLIVLRPLSLETIKQSPNCNVKDNTNTTNLEQDTRSEVINNLNNDLKVNLIETMTKLLSQSSIKFSSHIMKGCTNASSVESTTSKIPVESSKLEQANCTGPIDYVSSYKEKESYKSQRETEFSKQLSNIRDNDRLQDLRQISDSQTLKIPVEASNLEQAKCTGSIDFVSSYTEKETCSQGDSELSKQLSNIRDNNCLQDLGQILESPLWLEMLDISEDENLLKTCYSETSLLRLGINTYKKTLFDEFKPVSKSRKLKKKRLQLQLKNNRSLITLYKKNKGTQIRVTSKKRLYNSHIRERRQFWAEYRKTLVNTDQWKSYVRMFTPGSTQDFKSTDLSDSADLHSPITSQDLTLLEGGLDFAIVFSEIRRFKLRQKLFFPDKLSVKDQAMASRLLKCMSSFKGSQPNSPKSLKDSINYSYNINNERIEVEDTIRDVLDNVVSTVCTTRNECNTQNSDLNITDSLCFYENEYDIRENILFNVNLSDLAPVDILHKNNENDIVNLTIPEVDMADINNMNVPDLIKCSNVLSNLNETLITRKVYTQKDALEVNVLEKSKSNDIKNLNENNNENLSEKTKTNEDKSLNEPLIENCKTSTMISTECDSQNAIDFMDYYSCMETSMSRSNVNFISSDNTLLAKNSEINKDDVSVDVNTAVDYKVIKTNDFHVTNNFAYSIDDHMNSVLSEIAIDAEDNGSPSTDDSYNLCIVTNDDDVPVPDTFSDEDNEGEINTTKNIGTLPYDHKIVDTNEVSEVAIDLTVDNHEKNVNIYEGPVNELQQINSISITLEDVADNNVVTKIDSPKNFENIVQHEQDFTGIVSVEKIMKCQSNEDKLKTWNVASSSSVSNLDKVNIHDSKLFEPVTTDSDEWLSDDSSKPSTISSITHSNLDNMSFSDDSHNFGEPEPFSSHQIDVNSELYSNIDVMSDEDSNSVCSSLDDDKNTQVKNDVNNETNNKFIFPLIKTITDIASDDSNSEKNENSLSASRPSLREDRENDVENNIVSRELNNVHFLEQFDQQNLEHNSELSLSLNSVSLSTDIDPDQENIDFRLEESEKNTFKNATVTSGELREIDSDNELPINIQDELDTSISSSCNSPESDQIIKERDDVIFVNQIEVSTTIVDKIDLTETSNHSIKTNVPQNEFIIVLDDEDMKSPSGVSPIDPILEYEVHTSASNDSIITSISGIDNGQNRNDNSMDTNTNRNTSPLYETITIISSDDSNSATNEMLNSSLQSTEKYQENNAEIACNSSEDYPNMQDQEDVVADNSIEINQSKTNTVENLSTTPVAHREINVDSELAMYIEDVLGEISDSESDSLESDQSLQDVETDINPNKFVPTFNNDMISTTIVSQPSFKVSNKANHVTDTNPEDPNFKLAKSNTVTDLNSCEQDNYIPTSTISNSQSTSSDNSSSNGDSDNDSDLSESVVEKYDSDRCNRYSNAVLNIIPDSIATPDVSVQDYEDKSIKNSNCKNNLKPSEVSRQEDKDVTTNTRVHDNFKQDSPPPDGSHLLNSTATPTNISQDTEVQIKEHKDNNNLKKNISSVVDHSSNNQSANKDEEIPVTATTSTQQIKNSNKKYRSVYFNGTTYLMTSNTNFYIGDFSDLVNNDDGRNLYADIVATDQPANHSAASSTTSHSTTVTRNLTKVTASSSVTVSPDVTVSQTTDNIDASVHSDRNNETGPSNNMLDEASSTKTDFGVDKRPVYFHNRPTYTTNLPADMYADASVTFTGLPTNVIDPGLNDNFRFIENDNLESFYVDSISHHRFYNDENTVNSNIYRENNSVSVLNNYSKYCDNVQLPDQFDANEWKL
ncbi:serine-rich adhesin for platelets-like [Adelges cooleyi]|uniref:serine-rich adhesin for platelets-like n=1 Tax=Adelges cooleyi TaxID=133065 RepID=UPI00218004BB|nr:serine-rich adhesin for platelets-like [Adelges cooleyi]